MSRYCNTCNSLLLIGTNWTQAQKNKGTYKCNACKASYQRDYHNRNKEEKLRKQRERYHNNKEVYLEKQKEYIIKRQYGLSVQEYETLLANSPCNICGKEEDKVLDHCHLEGHPRGVLCRQCNMALGLFRDDPAIVEKARDYLLQDKGEAGIHVK